MRVVCLLVCAFAVAVSGRMDPLGPMAQPDIELPNNQLALVETTGHAKAEAKVVIEWVLLGIGVALQATSFGVDLYNSKENQKLQEELAHIRKDAAAEMKEIGVVLEGLNGELTAFQTAFKRDITALKAAYDSVEVKEPSAASAVAERKEAASHQQKMAEYQRALAEYEQRNRDYQSILAKRQAHNAALASNRQDRLLDQQHIEQLHEAKGAAVIEFTSTSKGLKKVDASLKYNPATKSFSVAYTTEVKHQASATPAASSITFAVQHIKDVSLLPPPQASSAAPSVGPVPPQITFKYDDGKGQVDTVQFLFYNNKGDAALQRTLYLGLKAMVQPVRDMSQDQVEELPVAPKAPVPPTEAPDATTANHRVKAYLRLLMPTASSQASPLPDELLKRDDIAQLDVISPGLLQQIWHATGITPSTLLEMGIASQLPPDFIHQIEPWTGVVLGVSRLYSTIRTVMREGKERENVERSLKFAAWELLDDTRYSLCKALRDTAIRAEREALVVTALRDQSGSHKAQFDAVIKTLETHARSMRKRLADSHCEDFENYVHHAPTEEVKQAATDEFGVPRCCPVVNVFPVAAKSQTDEAVVVFNAEAGQFALQYDTSCKPNDQPITSLTQYHYTPTYKDRFELHYSGAIDSRSYTPIMKDGAECATSKLLRDTLNKLEVKMNALLKAPMFPIDEESYPHIFNMLDTQFKAATAAARGVTAAVEVKEKAKDTTADKAVAEVKKEVKGEAFVGGKWVPNEAAASPEFQALLQQYLHVSNQFRQLVPLQLARDAEKYKQKREQRVCNIGVWDSFLSLLGLLGEDDAETERIKSRTCGGGIGRPIKKDWDMLLFSRSIGAPIVHILGRGVDCAALVKANIAAHEKPNAKTGRRSVGGWSPPSNVFEPAPIPDYSNYINTFVTDICYIKDYHITVPSKEQVQQKWLREAEEYMAWLSKVHVDAAARDLQQHNLQRLPTVRHEVPPPGSRRRGAFIVPTPPSSASTASSAPRPSSATATTTATATSSSATAAATAPIPRAPQLSSVPQRVRDAAPDTGRV